MRKIVMLVSTVLRTIYIGQTLIGIVMLGFILSCNQTEEPATKRATGDINARLLKKLVAATDENGNPTEVAGFVENRELKAGAIVDLKAAPSDAVATQKLFKFNKPDNYDAEYSEAIPIGGTNIASPNFEDCALKTYQPQEPIVADLLRSAAMSNICGQVSLNFCIKLTAKSQTSKAMTYIKTPPMKVDILCPEESFANVGLSIESGAKTTNKAGVDLKIVANSTITRMYVTNDSSCKSGGNWENLAAEKKAWLLAQKSGKATVYIAFKNFMEQESSCLSASITRTDNDSGNSGSGNAGTGDNESGAGNGAPDSTPPTGGVFSASTDIGETGFRLNWSAGSDTVTAAASLQYFVCSGASTAAIDTAAECTAANQAMGWTTNTLTLAITGKAPSTTYYYNVVVRDAAGNQAIYPGMSQTSNADSAPTAGTFSASTSVGDTGFTLNWSAGSDTFTAPSSLEYFICSGANATAIDTVAECTAATQAMGWTTNTLTHAITGKSPSTTYYYNVVVRDAAGNQAIYPGISQTTNADSAPTAGTFLASTSVGETGFTLTWSAGGDHVTAAASLQYFVCSGANAAAIDTVAECTVATQAMGWTANTLTLAITGKSPSTTYYYNVVVRDAAGNQAIYPGISQGTATDATPTAGTFSASTSVGDTGFTLNWSAGSDNVTSVANLQYFVCSGASAAAIDTAAECTATTQAMGWTANTLTLAITGKEPSTTYYYNVVVRDAAGNQAIYPGISQATSTDNAPTAGTFSSSTDVGDTGFTINWTAGSDNFTAAAGLQYFVCSGANAAAIDTAAECTAATQVMGWTANTLTLAVTGKSPSSTYYYNVVVRDAAGNQAFYPGISQATSADSAPTAGTFSASTNVATTSFTLNWSAGSDTVTAASSLQYFVCSGASAAAIDTAVECTAATQEMAWAANTLTLPQTGKSANTTYYYNVVVRDGAGNETIYSGKNQSTPSSSPTISISSGATYATSSSVTVGFSSTTANQMYITNTSGCGSDGSWETYATTKANWGLGQTNGTATVYVKYRDAALNESTCISDTIIHDATPPSDPASFVDGASSWGLSSSRTMSWTASTDGESGVAAYEIAIGTTAGATDVKTWTNVGNVTSASVSGLALADGSTYYGSIRALDNAGNPSSVVNGDGFIAAPPTWTQQAYIKASNNNASDFFGFSVALDSDTLAVGAYAEDSSQATITNGTSSSTDNSNSGSGAVYVYKRTGTSWAQEAYVKAGNSNSNDQFGWSVALTSDTLAVGAFGEDSFQSSITNGTSANANNTNTDSGAVYVYKRTGTSWAQQAYIKAKNNDNDDQFGYSIALASDTLAVGTKFEDSNQTTITNGTSVSYDNTNFASGAVYLYKRSGTSWTEQAYVKASNNQAVDIFGYCLALDSDTLAVGTYSEDSNQTTITNGTSASSDNTNDAAGAVYLYKRTGTSWAQEAYVKAINNDASDQFGSSVALSSDTLAVAAIGEDSNQTTITNGTSASTDNTSTSSGAVYLYKHTGTTWAQEAYIKASNNNATDLFGDSVALSSDTLAVGAFSEDGNQTTITNGTSSSTDNTNTDSGAVYIYTR